MSIIRDLLEYYRLPSVVQLHQLDFEVSHSILNGYEERFYYDKDLDDLGAPAPGAPYRMVIDQFTDDAIRFRRTLFVYDDNFVLQSISSQYDYGKKQKDESYVYGLAGGIDTITTVEIAIDVTWADQAPSTGWPSTGFNRGGGLNWIYVDASVSPAENGTGYMMDTTNGALTLLLPDNPDEGEIVGIEDTASNFDVNNVQVIRNSKNIMGLSDDLTLNEKNQGIQLVYSGDETLGWRIVWTTPLVANIVIP